MNDAPTLETDAAIVESNGQWSFTIREKMKKLERERNAARAEVESMQEAIKEAYANIKSGSDLWPVWVGTPTTTQVHQRMLTALAKLKPFIQ